MTSQKKKSQNYLKNQVITIRIVNDEWTACQEEGEGQNE